MMGPGQWGFCTQHVWHCDCRIDVTRYHIPFIIYTARSALDLPEHVSYMSRLISGSCRRSSTMVAPWFSASKHATANTQEPDMSMPVVRLSYSFATKNLCCPVVG